MKKNIMNCEKSLLQPVPPDVFPRLDYKISPPKADLSDVGTYVENRQAVSRQHAKREAFMLCRLVPAINDALRYYKTRACGTRANLNEAYTVHDDPSDY